MQSPKHKFFFHVGNVTFKPVRALHTKQGYEVPLPQTALSLSFPLMLYRQSFTWWCLYQATVQEVERRHQRSHFQLTFLKKTKNPFWKDWVATHTSPTPSKARRIKLLGFWL